MVSKGSEVEGVKNKKKGANEYNRHLMQSNEHYRHFFMVIMNSTDTFLNTHVHYLQPQSPRCLQTH